MVALKAKKSILGARVSTAGMTPYQPAPWHPAQLRPAWGHGPCQGHSVQDKGEPGAWGGDSLIDTKPISYKISLASGSNGKENHWAHQGDVKNAVDYSLGCSE